MLRFSYKLLFLLNIEFSDHNLEENEIFVNLHLVIWQILEACGSWGL